MTDFLTSVMLKLKRMSPEELRAQFAKHRDSDIARTLRQIEEVSVTCVTRWEDVFALATSKVLSEVRNEDFEAFTLESAANDERFALAA